MTPTYGTPTKDKCPSEEQEMATAFNWLRLTHPKYWAVAVHIRNEGARHARQMVKVKAQGGFVKGCADIAIPGCPSFVCEMKSRSKTARLSPEQRAYLQASADVGAFACVALGAEGFVLAFQEWLLVQPNAKP